MADKGKGKAPDEQPADKAAEPKPVDTVESEDESGEEDAEDTTVTSPGAAGDESQPKKKKKKSKTQKLKQMISRGHKDGDDESKAKNALGGLTQQQLEDFIKLNPALANEIQSAGGSSASPADLAETLKKLKVQDILTGLASSGKNRKDMASYKFWATQPVPQFGEETKMVEEGPLKIQTVDEIPSEPIDLVLEQFQWETMDLTDDAQMEEVYKLLNGHYVEDDDAQFRFKYSQAILRWALMSPGWRKDWHVGIRSGKTLCAFISAIPVQIRVRDKVVPGSEVNFLCVHKKLRNKRLAPVLIKEITRRCNKAGVFQAIYTGGIVLPRPVSTCRYFHRALDWTKLWEIGFSPLPPNSKPAFQVRKYALPDRTSTKGLREMEEKDIDAVYDLLTRYLQHSHLAPVFDRDEIMHWLLHKKPDSSTAIARRGATDDRVIYSYVVEDPTTKKITDFVSFYCLESSVISSTKHSVVRAAYLFYYATEVFFSKPGDKDALGGRLNELIHDALILAKKYGFDVFNALSLMENALFLEEQKFGPGDGQLHYYLFNYRANPIAGGVDKSNKLDKDGLSGVGFVML